MSESNTTHMAGHMTGHVPDLLLEQLHLGELPAAQAAALRARVESDAGTRARFEALAASDAAILTALPATGVAAEVQRRAHLAAVQARHAAPARSFGVFRVVAPVLTLAALALVVTRAPDPSEIEPALQPPGEEVIRTKGEVAAKGNAGADLLVFRKRADGVERMAEGAEASAGDLVQLGYHARRPVWVAIVSLDGRGQITHHLPVDGERAQRVRPGEAVMLTHSYELDDAPRFERFVLVTGKAAFDLSTVDESIRALARSSAPAKAALVLPEGLAHASFVVRKPEQGE